MNGIREAPVVGLPEPEELGIYKEMRKASLLKPLMMLIVVAGASAGLCNLFFRLVPRDIALVVVMLLVGLAYLGIFSARERGEKIARFNRNRGGGNAVRFKNSSPGGGRRKT